MRFRKFKKFRIIRISSHNIITYIIIFIFLLTIIFSLYYGKKVSDTILINSKIVIDDILTESVNNVKVDTLINSKINNLIKLSYNNKGEIDNISYDLENTYALLSIVRSSIDKDIKKLENGKINDTNILIKDGLIVNIPFYSFTKNLLIMNIGPTMKTKINILENLAGSITTKLKDYGINSLLIELYLVIDIKSTCFYTLTKSDIHNKYEILISSKIVQGGIPSYYNGFLENKSETINV